ncbi:hypothetical protein DMUE_3210 [Dictyocoela muelleri]|nr:hypothetical protein DMUE_3210 [Dictyocoela muelleri]
MGYTRKTPTLVPINRNSNENKILRRQYAIALAQITDERLIFLDESGFNLHLNKKQGYSPKNTNCFINVPNSKGTNISLLCAINTNRILATNVKIGSFKSVDMIHFINNNLQQLGPHERKYLIMDNASIHKTAEVREALALKNYILMFLPPYSPQLNPIEEFFSCFKAKVKQRPMSANSSSHIDLIRVVIETENFSMRGYFLHMRTC